MSRESNFEEQQSVSTDNENTTHKEVGKEPSSPIDPRGTWSPMPSPLPARNPIWHWVVTWLLLLGLAGIVIANIAGYRPPFLNNLSSATEPATTGPSATQPLGIEPSATEPSATAPSATESPTTEPSATEPSATEPSTTEPDGTEASVTQISVGTCSSVTAKLNFLETGLTIKYLIIPKDVSCLHIEKTGQARTLKDVGEYIEVKMNVWIESGYIVGGNSIGPITQGVKCFFEKPQANSLSSELLPEADFSSVVVTGNTENGYSEIIITGWLNQDFLKDPVPTPAPPP